MLILITKASGFQWGRNCPFSQYFFPGRIEVLLKALWQGQEVEKVELLNLTFLVFHDLCFCADVIKEVNTFSCMGLLYNDFLGAKKFIFVGVRHLHLLFSFSMSHYFKGIYGLYTYGFSFRIVFFIFLNLGIDISTAYVISFCYSNSSIPSGVYK